MPNFCCLLSNQAQWTNSNSGRKDIAIHSYDNRVGSLMSHSISKVIDHGRAGKSQRLRQCPRESWRFWREAINSITVATGSQDKNPMKKIIGCLCHLNDGCAHA
jgi:hypothetical protein